MPPLSQFFGDRPVRQGFQQRPNPLTRNGMTPVWSDFRQRDQDKAAFDHPGVRQDHRTVHDPSVIVQKIKIQRSWRIGRGTQPPQRSFHTMQKRQEFNGLESGFDEGREDPQFRQVTEEELLRALTSEAQRRAEPQPEPEADYDE